jgi:hypothetical protein
MARAKETVTESAFLNVSPSQFIALSDSKANGPVQAQSAIRRQQAWHAFFGIFFGTVTYLASLAASIYLATHGFPKLAAMALGTPVLTVIKRIIDSRI